ncbi:MAG: sodium-dependent transporter [Parvularculaceae bacterium]|nr:sodium-dependent transporter [Parvularculaceae bacterium]
MTSSTNATVRWTSNLGFILAAAGTAIGLGNVWRFTFIAGENGGGVFLFVYLLTVILVGVPIMIAELMAGRLGRGGPAQSVSELIRRHRTSPAWGVIGGLSVVIPFVGIAYYSIISGWILDYLAHYLALGGVAGGAQAMRQFDGLMASVARIEIWHAVFMLLVAFIVGRGVQGGIESTAKIFMPALFLMLIGLVIYAAIFGDFKRGTEFLFTPDFSKFSVKIVLLAVGQAFFSLAIGVGALMTFGAYVDDNASLPKTAALVALADTMVAVLAGLAIFPLVFANGLDVNQGPGLIFITLPTAFENMQGGQLVGACFFALLFFAALTTGIGTMEPVVAWLVGRGVKRPQAALVTDVSARALGGVIALSFNVLRDFRPIPAMPFFAEMSLFDVVDFSIASLLLPLNGLLIVLFVGWALPRSVSASQIAGAPVIQGVWRFLVRYVAPLAILSVFIGIITAT